MMRLDDALEPDSFAAYKIMTSLPAIYIASLFARPPDRINDGITLDRLAKLLDLLDEAKIQTPGMASLLGATILNGAPASGVLMILGDGQLQSISTWANMLNQKGFSSLFLCTAAQVDSAGFLREDDAPLLIGHGIALASRGASGRPLVGMPLAQLRRELQESQQKLSRLAGYPVGILAPTVSTLGHAIDGLVLEEARRAGYRLILEPGGRVTDLSVTPDSVGPDRLDYRIVSTNDAPTELANWIIGTGLSRPGAQIREFLQRPRRILTRLKLT